MYKKTGLAATGQTFVTFRIASLRISRVGVGPMKTEFELAVSNIFRA